MGVMFRRAQSLAFALAVSCVLLAAAAGVFAPAAAAAPDAAQIDDFLALHASPMVGAGGAFVAAGQAYGVDPAFLVAIAGAETSFGQFLYAENGDQCTYNAFNWFYGPTWPQSDFGSWEEAIGRVAQGLAGELYYGAGLFSVEAIAPKYCPVGTGNWISNVTSFTMQLGGNPADTRLAGATALPPDTQPGLFALAGSVTLSGGARLVGRDVRVRFTIINRGGLPIALEGLRLAVRGPAGANADRVSDKAVTLAPGQPMAVTASWSLDTVGRWHGWVEVLQNGVPSLVGEKQAFAFRVALPRDLVVRRWVMTETRLSSLD